MGEIELSHFLPSRQTGVNDMSIHFGFMASRLVAQRDRLCAVWAILRLRHPMLPARVEMQDYDDVRFIYDAPFPRTARPERDGPDYVLTH
ncbi:hypothetical protein OH77DRAFT_1518460 [Trametes cingulata]|nr:hypothetical protein OH77DRAFT_1518460 [Trametes cingulata]